METCMKYEICEIPREHAYGVMLQNNLHLKNLCVNDSTPLCEGRNMQMNLFHIEVLCFCLKMLQMCIFLLSQNNPWKGRKLRLIRKERTNLRSNHRKRILCMWFTCFTRSMQSRFIIYDFTYVVRAWVH